MIRKLPYLERLSIFHYPDYPPLSLHLPWRLAFNQFTMLTSLQLWDITFLSYSHFVQLVGAFPRLKRLHLGNLTHQNGAVYSLNDKYFAKNIALSEIYIMSLGDWRLLRSLLTTPRLSQTLHTLGILKEEVLFEIVASSSKRHPLADLTSLRRLELTYRYGDKTIPSQRSTRLCASPEHTLCQFLAELPFDRLTTVSLEYYLIKPGFFSSQIEHTRRCFRMLDYHLTLPALFPAGKSRSSAMPLRGGRGATAVYLV
ncbi:hypothetical protein OBBRIDRAFT_32698 [Obba rivulosa]|uniref:Uncharacterized protein n=1 Tax=Obba rivulosa TaxID=1052685 RepID=A0A8E2AYZ9_9APHY|nr:hypothetical protein OBBRIDRAFT_32698 [Obba rivulosa]